MKTKPSQDCPAKEKAMEGEMEVELNKMVKLGILVKEKGRWKDSPYCKKLDKMSPREAFMEGLNKGEQKLQEQAKEIKGRLEVLKELTLTFREVVDSKDWNRFWEQYIGKEEGKK